jgi:flavin-dependent dehydrogenase
VDRSCDYDVAILGGAFSGASSALLLKRSFPDLRVLIIDRTTDFDRKVGESTSEVAGCFLTRVLDLGMHLSAQHIGKHGLRMWFSDEKNRDADPGRCTETGPMFQGRLPAFQLNRKKLDAELLRQAEELGCELARPVTLKNLVLGGAGKNTFTLKAEDKSEREVTAAWVIDASGKAALIPRQRKQWRSHAEQHPTSSIWTRFQNVTYLDSQEGREKMAGVSEKVRALRQSATNHLMGDGWWCWIIPLDNGEVSAGLTWDRRLFTPPSEGSMAERLHRHLLDQPVGRVLFENAKPVEEDNRYYKDLAYYAKEVTGEGFTVVGDAAGFMDPLYSQGLDYCAHTIYSSYYILRNYFSGQTSDELAKAIALRNKQFRLSYQRWFDSLYREKYYYLGDAEIMSAAYLLDIATYFIGPVRLVHVAEDAEFSKLPYDGAIGAAFAKFMTFYNRRFAVLARKKKAAGTFGNKNCDHHYLLSGGFSPGAPSLKLLRRGVWRWLGIELRLAFVKPAPEAAPERGNRQQAETHGEQNTHATEPAHAG